MKLFNPSCWVRLTLTLWLSVSGEWFKDKAKDCEIEAQFKQFHSDIDNLHLKPWSLADDLNKDTLKNVCDEVLADNYPSFRPPGQFSYTDPAGELPLQKERVLRNASVVCSQGIKYIPLIHCCYNGTDFYLAKGNETHVFRLGKDPIDEIFYFQSGAHVIHYNNSGLISSGKGM